jgi:hypothetical protein
MAPFYPPKGSASSRAPLKRPPVNAAPAEIVAPISLRRVKPGEQAASAGNGAKGANADRNAPVASGSGFKGAAKTGQGQGKGQKKAQDLPARPDVPRQPVASTSGTSSGSKHSLAERIFLKDPEDAGGRAEREQASERSAASGRGRGRGRGRGGVARGGGAGRGGNHSDGRENGRAAANGASFRRPTKDPRILYVGPITRASIITLLRQRS